MPYLTVGAYADVPVSARGVRRSVVQVGDLSRAFDGTMRSTIRAYKDEYAIVTTPMTRANADTLEGVLQGSQPLTCSGDLLGGSTTCHAEYQGTTHVGGPAGAERVIVSFRLLEE